MYLNPNHLNKISMSPPRILMIEGFSQNLLLSATTLEEVHKLFRMAQTIDLEALEWISEARRHCELIMGFHSWHWDNPEAGTVAVHTRLPLLEGQGQIEYGLDSAPISNFSTSCDALSDASKAVIIHPCHYAWITDHPEYNPFTSLNPIPGPPVYQTTTPSIEDLVMGLNISSKE